MKPLSWLSKVPLSQKALWWPRYIIKFRNNHHQPCDQLIIVILYMFSIYYLAALHWLLKRKKEGACYVAFIKKVLPPHSEWEKTMTDTLSNLCFSSWRLVEHWLKSRKVALNPSRPSPVNLETVSAREQRNRGKLFCIIRRKKQHWAWHLKYF